MSKFTLWSLLAIITASLYVLLILTFGLFIIKNIGVTVTLGLTSFILIYSIWSIFTATNKNNRKYTWLAAAASIALLLQLLYLLFDQKNRRAILLIASLTVIYIALIKYLNNMYRLALREQKTHTENTADFKKPYLIINPKSGDGRAIKANLEEIAKQQGIKVIMTQKNKDIADSALEAVKAGADALGISGGDGSIGAVAKVAIDNNLPLVVLPGGTRCHFARDLGLDPKYIVDALASFKGVEKLIDIGDINGRIFLNNASFGLYADIVNHPQYRENKLQISKQVLQDILTKKKDAYDLRLKHNSTIINKAVQILVGVNRYDTVNLLDFGQREKLDEGVLQITVITKLTKDLVRKMLSAVSVNLSVRQNNIPGFFQWTNQSLVVKSSSKKIAVGVDGECEYYDTPVEIKIIPKKLRIYVPAEGIRNRQKNPLSMKSIKSIRKQIV